MAEPGLRDIGIYCLDVGQGDCTVIIPPAGDGDAIVFDVADQYVLERFVANHEIAVSDVIASHLDIDHIRGMLGFLINCGDRVDRAYIGLDRTPHHGGEATEGGQVWKTYPELYDRVEAELGVVSVGTGNGYEHPKLDHIRAVRRGGECRLLCTQLTPRCHGSPTELREAMRNQATMVEPPIASGMRPASRSGPRRSLARARSSPGSMPAVPSITSPAPTRSTPSSCFALTPRGVRNRSWAEAQRAPEGSAR